MVENGTFQPQTQETNIFFPQIKLIIFHAMELSSLKPRKRKNFYSFPKNVLLKFYDNC